jgi:histone acetyltransferase (RNA polymerase elongator complex component)
VNPINFLIEENYAKSPEAAHKILEAASEDFHDYILQEARKKSRIKNLLKKASKTALKKALKSKPVEAVKRFVGYTTLGSLF